jgi:hypothetical protein
MDSVPTKPEVGNTQTDTSPTVKGCELGRELADCPLKRVGCGSLYSALMHVMPPWHLRIYVREQLPHDKEAQAWLRRLDDATPGARPASNGGWW